MKRRVHWSIAALFIAGTVVIGAQGPPHATRTFSSLGDSKTMTLKQFNDAFLHEGEMPIEMMRAALAKKPLTRNYNANWKFYGDVEPAKP